LSSGDAELAPVRFKPARLTMCTITMAMGSARGVTSSRVYRSVRGLGFVVCRRKTYAASPSVKRAHCQFSEHAPEIWFCVWLPGPSGLTTRQFADGVGTGVGVSVGVGVRTAHCPEGRHTASNTGTQPGAHTPSAGGPHVGSSHWQQSAGPGVWVGGPPGVWVRVGVADGLTVGEAVGLEVAVSAGVALGVPVCVEVDEAEGDAVAVRVADGVALGVVVALGVEVNVADAVAVAVTLGVAVTVGVALSEGVVVMVGVAVKAAHWPAAHAALNTGLQPGPHWPLAGRPQENAH
jgi:hypothetical protein